MAVAITNPYELSEIQWRFVQEYLQTFNGSEAYQKAGYKARGNAAEAGASRLLRTVKVQVALRTESQKLLDRYDVTPEKVVREYARLGFTDMRHYAAWDATGVHLKPSSTLDDDSAASIAEVSEETRSFGDATTRTVKFKLHSKTDGLNGLAKYLDLFGETKALGAIGEGLASLLEKKS
jgi:phage terminase small subunit